MISIEENGKLGTLLPIIQAEYGLDKADELCLAAIEANSLMDLGPEHKKMLEMAIGVVKSSKKKAQKPEKVTKSDCVTFRRGNEELIFKYNPYHDSKGRFSSKNGYASYSMNTKLDNTHKPWGENNSLMEHLDTNTGKISKERVALYNKIINDTLNGIKKPDPPPPVLEFMGGGGGSGKGYTISTGVVQVPDKKNALHVDSDEIKLKFPEFSKIAASDDIEVAKTAANYVHEESSIVAKMLVKVATEKGLNIVMDGVASDPQKISQEVAKAKSNGYKTKAHYVSAPTEVAVKDNYSRFHENKNINERRMVPEEVIRRAHRDVSANFPELAKLYDEVEVVTNDRVSAPKRIAYKDASGKIVATDPAEYQKFLGKANEKVS